MKILHFDKDKKKWSKIDKKYYENEAQLQNLLSDDINILPLEDIGYTTPFVTIGKEISLQNGCLDLLAVSPEGHIALIETKLDKNPEVKRTVVGQILGYAAYLWNQSYEDLERDCFKKFLIQQKIKFEGSLSDYIKEKSGYNDFSDTDFKAGIEKRLQLGGFSLLIVVDKANQELKDIANYLNDRTGQGIDFYVAEMEYIGNRNEQFLIPRLANPPRKNVIATQLNKNTDNYDRTPITQEEFLQRLSEHGKDLAKKLINEFKSSEDVKLAWRKNGFSLMTPFPKSLITHGGYTNFSYLFLQINGHGDAELKFGYPDEQYDKYKQTNPLIEDYVKFYRSIKGYEKHSIVDLHDLDQNTIKSLIDLIKTTSKKLLNQ
jgi:hypothetical protein